MRIIGHRGGAKLALENTISAIETALKVGVDAIEIDVHMTADGHIVLHHDNDLKRLAGDRRKISQLTLKELRTVRLQDGSHVPTLIEALKAAKDTTMVIELKQRHTAEPVLALTQKHAKGPVAITSFLHAELRHVHKLAPTVPIYAAEHFSPFEIVASARKLRADGITINAWLLNPLTYWLCRHYNLEIIAYTVDSPFIAWFLQRLYPHTMICTDRPDRFRKQHREFLRNRRSATQPQETHES